MLYLEYELQLLKIRTSQLFSSLINDRRTVELSRRSMAWALLHCKERDTRHGRL